MREIKFRAWNKDTNNWLEGVTYTLHTSGRLIVTPPHVELTQYTGLKDKTGKEIYEGDIVHYDYHNALFEVQWCDGKGEWLRSQVGWHLISGDYTVEFEAHLEVHEFDQEEYFNGSVIGNIYENPELMPKENN